MGSFQIRRAAVKATLGLSAVSLPIAFLAVFIVPKVVWFPGLYLALAFCAIPIWFLLYFRVSPPEQTDRRAGSSFPYPKLPEPRSAWRESRAKLKRGGEAA